MPDSGRRVADLSSGTRRGASKGAPEPGAGDRNPGFRCCVRTNSGAQGAGGHHWQVRRTRWNQRPWFGPPAPPPDPGQRKHSPPRGECRPLGVARASGATGPRGHHQVDRRARSSQRIRGRRLRHHAPGLDRRRRHRHLRGQARRGLYASRPRHSGQVPTRHRAQHRRATGGRDDLRRHAPRPARGPRCAACTSPAAPPSCRGPGRCCSADPLLLRGPRARCRSQDRLSLLALLRWGAHTPRAGPRPTLPLPTRRSPNQRRVSRPISRAPQGYSLACSHRAATRMNGPNEAAEPRRGRGTAPRA
jgi:hypothetical protein